MFQPLMETGFLPWTNILLVLLVCNVIWVGYVTINQKRLDLLLGNSSVMHMGYIFLAFAALVVSGSAEANPWALKGAALLMLAHGLTIALLFLLCGQIEKQTGTLEINSLGGLSTRLPRMAFVFGLAGMASIGLPGLANFPGNSWSSSPVSPVSATASAPFKSPPSCASGDWSSARYTC